MWYMVIWFMVVKSMRYSQKWNGFFAVGMQSFKLDAQRCLFAPSFIPKIKTKNDPKKGCCFFPPFFSLQFQFYIISAKSTAQAYGSLGVAWWVFFFCSKRKAEYFLKKMNSIDSVQILADWLSGLTEGSPPSSENLHHKVIWFLGDCIIYCFQHQSAMQHLAPLLPMFSEPEQFIVTPNMTPL